MAFRFTNTSSAKKIGAALVMAASFALSSTSAVATPVNLVKNGGFELNTNGNGQIGHYTSVIDWTSKGYNFLFASGTADTSGALGVHGRLTLWGAANFGANALASSHNGGFFIANDGAYDVQAISQTINGLTVGATYEVSFEWAAAQQHGFDGATTEWWRVNLGSDISTTQATGIYSNAEHGSSQWMQETMRFTATSTSEVLSFLAHGTPVGLPPFSLLDGVSMTEVPEPSSWLMLFTGLGLIAAMARRRQRDTA